MEMILRRRTTGEILLSAGGTWDRWRRRYLPSPPIVSRIIDVNESQVEFVRYFALVLQTLREGRILDDSLAAAVGDRRAGKTFITVLCVIAFLLEVPRLGGTPTISWIVNATYQDRDEIEQEIENEIPSSWYVQRGAPEYRYFFANGGVLRNLSAKDPESLRRGRADVILYNEAQKMSLDALSNGIYGTSDRGGLAILAANPPKKKIGEWVFHLKSAYDEERIGGVQFFQLSSKDNATVVRPARERVGAILRLLDPKRAAVDEEGLFLPIGDRAYEAFNGIDNVKRAPHAPEIIDVTGELVRRKMFGKWEFFGGCDFQGEPWNAAVILQAFGDPKEPSYYVVAEFLKNGWEDDLIDEIVFAQTFTPENTLLVGDASGSWQDSHHTRGRVSFDIFKARRWRIVPPQIKKSDRGDHPRNPDVLDRVNLVNKLLAQGRLFIDGEKCPRLVEALRECDWRNDKPAGKHAHETDALGYALWWAEPKPKPMKEGPKKGRAIAVSAPSRGPRIL